MKKETINRKINNTLNMVRNFDGTSPFNNYERLMNLYRKYLKLQVMSENIPKDYVLSKGNCYFYALGLPIPDIFYQKYWELYGNIWQINVGEVGKDYRILTNKLALYKYRYLLEALYADLETLKIKSYECNIDSMPTHNGFKIAIFSYNNSWKGDYHFVRQNPDGTWMQKLGYSPYISSCKNILEFIDDYNRKKDTDYEYVKTLELVKPVIYHK